MFKPYPLFCARTARRTIVIVCSAFAIACGTATDLELADQSIDSMQSEITGGQVDTSRPAVGALVDPTTLQIFCSGTLISSTRFLSAAHCLDGSSAGSQKVAFGPDENNWTHVVDVIRVKVHPDYDDMSGTRPSDIAYVDLASAPSGITPIPAMSNSVTGREGESWLFMGYGVDAQEAKGPGDLHALIRSSGTWTA